MNKQKGKLIEYITISVKYGGVYAWISIVSMLLVGILPVLEVQIVAEFIDQLLIVVLDRRNMQDVWLLMVGMGAIIAFLWVIEKVSIFTDAKLVYRLRENFVPCLIEKCARMKYVLIEDEKVQDRIKRVTKEPEKEVFAGGKEILSLISLGIRTIGIIGIITTKIWWCGIIVLLLHIPVVCLAVKSGKNAYQADKDFMFHMRKYEYLDGILTGRECAMERNVFGYYDYVHEMWNMQYEKATSKYLKAFFRYFFASRIYGIFSVLISLIMVLFLLQPVIEGKISKGLFIALVSNLLTAVSVIMQQLSYNVRELSRRKSYIMDLNEFLGMEEERDGVLECPSKGFQGFHTLEFVDVSFKYPGADEYVLKNVSFCLEAGKRYAFVGENAAGKTTITKLMLGFYEDYTGEILINGKELRQYSILELKELYSVVYQDFARYQVSVRDNVVVGALYLPEKSKEYYIKKVLEEVNLNNDIEKMYQKADTVLGKLEVNDSELSMGQWQRIAIARAMISEAPICILDEPSSFLDPISENYIYETYSRFNPRKTIVFITHRLGAIKLVDYIFVLHKGGLEAQGTYEELMVSNERFRTMYETQRGMYE